MPTSVGKHQGEVVALAEGGADATKKKIKWPALVDASFVVTKNTFSTIRKERLTLHCRNCRKGLDLENDPACG